jgi:hypothetical protein
MDMWYKRAYMEGGPVSGFGSRISSTTVYSKCHYETVTHWTYTCLYLWNCANARPRTRTRVDEFHQEKPRDASHFT